MVVAAVAIAGCQDTGTEGASVADSQDLTRTYTAPTGGVREVDARLTWVAVHPPVSELPVALPAGTRGSVADIRVTDRGEDRFPLEWASFSARTAQGRTLKEALRLPARRVDDETQLVPVGFAVPEGDALAEVRIASIVDVWPFGGSLDAPGGDDEG